MRASSWIGSVLVLAAVAVAGCGSGSNSASDGKGKFIVIEAGGGSEAAPFDATFGDGWTTLVLGGDGGSQDAAPINPDAQGLFAIAPAGLQTITVPAGQSTPAVTLTATLSGLPVDVGWNVDRGDLGTVAGGPSSTTAFTPSGATGGLVTVTAGFNGKTATVQVFIKLTATQSGANAQNPAEQAQLATSAGQLTAGGGIGGVGGEGLGGPVTDPPTLGALAAPSGTGSAQNLTLLYPYDKTVWPRGMIAPLLMWQWSYGDADAIEISLSTTSGSFSWTGTFDRPAVLTTGQPFIRHPIPQDVWDMATNTAGGPTPSGMPDDLTVGVTIAKAIAQDGGPAVEMGFGPISETWPVAPGRLPGVIYYNSYGTQLVQNSIEHSYNNGPQFGAAVLSIAQGATAPTVVAGTPSALGSGSGCRVCHVVSSGGSRLIAQHGDNNYASTSVYDLKNGNAETPLIGYNNLFGWAGLSTDGSLAFTNAADLAAGGPASQLYAFPPTSTTPLAVTGIPANLQAGTPMFSPDGKHVAFDFLGGTIGTTNGSGTQLVAMDFDATQNGSRT